MTVLKNRKKGNDCNCSTVLLVDDNEFDIYSLNLQLKYLHFISECTNKA